VDAFDLRRAAWVDDEIAEQLEAVVGGARISHQSAKVDEYAEIAA
jgi:hypothetical protein